MRHQQHLIRQWTWQNLFHPDPGDGPQHISNRRCDWQRLRRLALLMSGHEAHMALRINGLQHRTK
jgi:hypothetical protein